MLWCSGGGARVSRVISIDKYTIPNENRINQYECRVAVSIFSVFFQVFKKSMHSAGNRTIQ